MVKKLEEFFASDIRRGVTPSLQSVGTTSLSAKVV